MTSSNFPQSIPPPSTNASFCAPYLLWLSGIERYIDMDLDGFDSLKEELKAALIFRDFHVEEYPHKGFLYAFPPKSDRRIIIFYSGGISPELEELIETGSDTVIFLRRPNNCPKHRLIEMAANKGVPFVTQPVIQFDHIPGIEPQEMIDDSKIYHFKTNNIINVNGDIHIHCGEKTSRKRVYTERFWSFMIGILVNVVTGKCRLLDIF